MTRRTYVVAGGTLLALVLASLAWVSPAAPRHEMGQWGAAATGKVARTDSVSRALRGEHGEHHHHHEDVETIRRLWEPNSFANTDLGDPGITPGDTYSFGGPLFTVRDHKKRGFLSGTCTWTGPLDDSDTLVATCQVTTAVDEVGEFPSAGSQITLEGFNDSTPVDHFQQTITGGSGRWRGATGDVLVNTAGRILITYHISR